MALEFIPLIVLCYVEAGKTHCEMHQQPTEKFETRLECEYMQARVATKLGKTGNVTIARGMCYDSMAEFNVEWAYNWLHLQVNNMNPYGKKLDETK